MNSLKKLLEELPEEYRKLSLAPSYLFKKPVKGDFGYNPFSGDLDLKEFDTTPPKYLFNPEPKEEIEKWIC